MNPNDGLVVRAINESAFNRPAEIDLVDDLRPDGAVLLSLVAEWNTESSGTSYLVVPTPQQGPDRPLG